jgi:monomeric sarcosine oxidase
LTSADYDVAVVGAGVFGSWIAYKLLRSGKKVLLVDAFGAGNSRSSSGDESRIIRLGYGADEIYSRMAMDSLRDWQELFARKNCNHLFQPTGVLWMGKKDDQYMVDSARVLKRLGTRMEEFPLAELQRRYPQFNCEGVDHALFEPQSGALLGRRAVQAVWHAFIEEGGAFLLGKVAAAKNHSTSITLENGDRISAAQFVFACGPWLGKLFPELLGDRLFVSRQEVFYFGAPSGPEYRLNNLPIWLHMNDQVYGFPDLENRGVKVAFDEHGPPFDPDLEERLVSRESLARMREYVAKRLPALARSPVAETRVCQYENTSNGDFFLDRHPEAENIWLAGGGSGHGFKHGPAVGAYLLSQIDGVGSPEPRFSLAAKASLQNRTVF